MQVGQQGSQWVGAGKPGRRFKALETAESRGGSLPLGNRYCTVQLVNRGGCDPFQHRVTLRHSVPASLLKRGSEAVFSRDPGLRVAPAKAIALCGFCEPLQSDLNSLPFPELSVL